MDQSTEKALMDEVSIDSFVVELTCIVLEETHLQENFADMGRTHTAIFWLRGAGLSSYQAIRATTLARHRLGWSF